MDRIKTKSVIIDQQAANEERAEKNAQLQELEESSDEEERDSRTPWIDAWTDKLAGVHSVSSLMSLYDLKCDGDYKLVICDLLHNFSNKQITWTGKTARKLKVYMGTQCCYETYIPETPVGMTIIYDKHHKPYGSMIAVAAGSTLYFIKDF